MKVLIITEGGRDTGFGHITRCLSLAQAFEEREIHPELIVNGDESVEALLKSRKHETFNWLTKKEKILNMIKKAQILILDSYIADIKFYKKLSDLVEAPVYIDDNKRIDYPRGVVVNGTIYAKNIDYPKKKNLFYLLGVEFAPLRKQFWNAPRKGIKENIESVMFTFGGNDKKNVTIKMLKFFVKEYPELRKNIIVSDGFQNVKVIENLKDQKTDLIHKPSVEQIKKIMLESDLAISTGGQTLYELARTGVPTIGICVEQNQLNNVISWEKFGFLEFIGWYNSKYLIDNLRNSMKHLENMDIRKRKSKLGKSLVDGKGSLRIVSSILSNYFKNHFSVKQAKLDDALDVFKLSNEDTVRKNSFKPEKIEWNHHIKWFKEKLNDKNCVFLISNVLGRFAGQTRFYIDQIQKEATIDFSLVKRIRGLGLSSFILNKSIDTFLITHKNIKTIKACIKEKNLKSIKSFEGANFKYYEDIAIENNKAKLYIRTNND